MTDNKVKQQSNINPGSPEQLAKDLANACSSKNIKKIKNNLDIKSMDQVLKEQNLNILTHEQCFNNLIELETEVVISVQLFHKKHQSLLKEKSKFNPDQKTIDGYKEQLATLASSTFQTSLSLVNYYHGYDSEAQIKKYQHISNELYLFLEDEFFQNNAEEQNLLSWMKQQAKEQGADIVDTLLKASKMHDAISNANLARTYWIYCRLTVNQIITVGEQFDIINLNSGNTVINDLNVLNPVTNPASVAFYGARFLIDSTLLLKHTLWPSEKEAEIYWAARLSKEWETRKISIFNNIVWGITNLLTNYTFAGLPLANQLTAAVMIVDVAIASWVQAEEKKKNDKTLSYFKKKVKELEHKNEELKNQIIGLEKELKDLKLPGDKEKITQNKSKVKKLKSQLKQNNIYYKLELEKIDSHKNNWLVKDKIYNFNKDASIITLGAYISIAAPDLAFLIPGITPILAPILAFAGMGLAAFQIGKHNKPLAGLLTVGFTAAYVLCPPVALLISFTVGLSAMAIYLSNKEINLLNEAKQNYWTFTAEILSKKDESLEQAINRIKTMSYTKLKTKIFELKNLDENSSEIKELENLYAKINSCKYNLAKSMLEKTLVPIVIFFTFAACWPAAVAIIVTYLAAKLYQANKTKKAPQVSDEDVIAKDDSNFDNSSNFYSLHNDDIEDIEDIEDIDLPSISPTK